MVVGDERALSPPPGKRRSSLFDCRALNYVQNVQGKGPLEPRRSGNGRTSICERRVSVKSCSRGSILGVGNGSVLGAVMQAQMHWPLH